MDINQLTGVIVDAAVKIHKRIGPGLLESVYETLLAGKLSRSGHSVRRQVLVPVILDGIEFEHAFRADLIVDNCIVVELKAEKTLSPIDHRQILTYTRLLDFRVGLLLNFGAAYMKDGIVRVVNGLDEPLGTPRSSASLR
jgi:iron complex transport system substrate-binding protein